MSKTIGNEPVPCADTSTMAVVEDALHSLWGAFNKLSRVRPARPPAYTVTIFGSARIAPGQRLYVDVARLAEELTRRGCDIVTGGGPGLMQAANEGAQRGDPDDRRASVGVRVALPFEQGANPFVEQVYTHETFYTRLHHFVRLSSAFIVVDGGIGTTLELFLVWQLLQVRHVTDVPLVLVGPMWHDLVRWARQHMSGREPALASAEDIAMPLCVDTVDDAIAQLAPHIEAFARAPLPSVGG
jgi:uncharacterized protein (TIGR00730 family)